MCWHQGHPFGGDSWVKGPEAVTSLFPGGNKHESFIKQLDIVAAFVKSLRGNKGEAIPILFRPYHEQSGDWFWWGKTRCKSEDYIKLWQMTHAYLRETKGVHNFIYVQSPSGNALSTPADYMDMYPGDDYVDVLGLDFYFGCGDEKETTKLIDILRYISGYAKQNNKVAALTETGDCKDWAKAHDNLAIPNWYTRCFLGPIKAEGVELAYGTVWRNASVSHHFAPYPGHPAVDDFMNFFKDSSTIFLKDIATFDIYGV